MILLCWLKQVYDSSGQDDDGYDDDDDDDQYEAVEISIPTIKTSFNGYDDDLPNNNGKIYVYKRKAKVL